MARLYISSTYQDLRDARGVAWTALKKIEHDAKGMEGYAAADARPVELCRADVARCDGYIGILGARYGWVPDGYDGKSITQLEYEEAGRRGLPRLMFLMEMPAGQAPEPAEAAFRALVQTESTPKPVRDLAALEAEVMAAVVQQFGSGREVPPLLPYLCDRSEQVLQFKAAFEASFSDAGDGRPLMVIVHGDEREAHGKFIERLSKNFIPEHWNPVGRRSSAIKSFVLSWPTEWRPPQQGYDRLLAGLSLELKVRSLPDLVVDGFARIPGLCFVQAHVLTDDCRQSGAGAIAQFVDFWEGLPVGDARPTLIVTLSVKYKRRSKLGLLDWRTARMNQQMEAVVLDLGRRSPGALRVAALPRLTRVNRNQADEWAERDEIRRFCDDQDLGPSIRRTFEDSADGNQMSMEDLAEKLRVLLMERRGSREALR